MIKKISIIIAFLLLICGISTADNYIINDDTVYIDDSKVYLSATPHTLSSSGWVYFNLTSKVYTGNIDACWGFNTSVSKPTKADVYSPYWINTTTNHQKIFYNPTYVVYTGDNLDYGNSYNLNYKYTINESIINDNGTIYTTSNAAFDSFDMDGINYTIYWHTRHDNYYLWEDFSSSFNSIIYDYKGYNKWYYIKNVPITSNKEYTVRAWIDVPVSTEKQFGKYYFAIKPSYETISQAITNEHFYNLDPWWDATWSNRKNITLIGNTSGAQTDYQLLLNVTYDSDMQSDFDDLRFCNETHKLDSWLESKVDDSYALVWVEFPTTPANGVNQTYYMYYKNAEAISDWDGDGTFLFFDNFCGDMTKWVYTGFTIVNNELKTNNVIDAYAYHDFLLTNAHIIEYDCKIMSALNEYTISGFGSNPPFDAIGEIFFRSDGTNIFLYENSDIIFTIGDWVKIKLNLNDKKIYANDVYKTTSAYSGDHLQFGIVRGDKHIGYYDDFRVRKYVENPPAYTFGSEEYYMPPPPTTLIEETGLIMSEITTGLKSVNMGNYLVYAFILIGILLIILSIQIIVNGINRG